MNHRVATGLMLAALAALPLAVVAQERETPLADVLNIDATVSSDVAPDLAVMTLAFVREGSDVAALTRDVNETLARAFAEAKKVPAVIASSGSYGTTPHFDDRPTGTGPARRTGWQVQAEIVLKSRDFEALGGLVGRLSQTLQITRSGFEISSELRSRESAALLDRGARAFQDKAAAAARAFGYAGYSIRQVSIGDAQQGDTFRAKSFAMAQMASAPLPVQSGEVTLTLTVSGALQLRK